MGSLAGHPSTASTSLTAACLPHIPCLQAVLLQLLREMFPEGQGKPNAKAKLATVVPKINELFVNAKAAVDKFFKERGYTRMPTRTCP